jgi:hypothetical protein
MKNKVARNIPGREARNIPASSRETDMKHDFRSLFRICSENACAIIKTPIEKPRKRNVRILA